LLLLVLLLICASEVSELGEEFERSGF